MKKAILRGAFQIPDPRPPRKTHKFTQQVCRAKCSKTHLQQTRMSKIFLGQTTRTPATGSALEHNEQGRQLSNAGPD